MKKAPQPEVPFLDAVTLFRSGQIEAADRKCRLIISSDPTHVDAMHLRAMIAMRRRDTAAATALMERALAIKPRDAALLCNLGNMHMATGQADLALPRFLAALSADPGLVQAEAGAGAACNEQGLFVEAEPHFRAVLKRAPRDVEALLGLARSLECQARASEAAEIARRAIAAAPDNALPQSRLAAALEQLHDLDGAIAAHRRALVLSGNAPAAWFGLVVSLAAFGKLAEAEAECRALIVAHPDFALAHIRLTTLVRQSSLAEIAELQRLLDTGRLLPEERIEVEFALGAAHESRAAYVEAFGHFDIGNRLVRRGSGYDISRSAAIIAAIRSAFSAEALTRHAGTGCRDPMPVFIVGMPRSGTTLVEQILCSHPDIHGANELETATRLFREFAAPAGLDALPDTVAKTPPAEWKRMGEAYVGELRAYASGARYVVDKLPANFALLGFLSLILPEARFIHCRRDPLDTCVSIYKTRFTRGSIEYGYDMSEIGRYYRLYDDLMGHWNRILAVPPTPIAYEDLVTDLRGETERLLAALGLDWADTCARYYETQRSVLTASVAQVRRPLYSSSIGYAARFGPALEPLRRALAGEAVAASSAAG